MSAEPPHSASEIAALIAREHTRGRHEQVIAAFEGAKTFLLTFPPMLLAVSERVLDSAERLGRTDTLLTIHHLAGICHSQLGDNLAARRESEQALSIAEQLNDIPAQARAQAVLGQVARHLDELATGRERLTRALELYRRAGERRGEAQSLGDLGNLEDDAGRKTVALRHYDEALELFAALGDWESLAKVHSDTQASLFSSNLERAVAHGLLAAAARQEANDQYGKEGVLWGLANCLTTYSTVPVDRHFLELWPNTAQGAKAIRLVPELETRISLCSLSTFEPDKWSGHDALIADPSAEQVLRRAAQQLLDRGDVTDALRFEVLADTLVRARTVGPVTASQEELSLRESLGGGSEILDMLEAIGLSSPDQPVPDVQALDAIRDNGCAPLADGILQLLAGQQILADWQAARDASQVIEQGISRLEDALSKLGPSAGGMWWLEAIRDLGSAYRHRMSGDRSDNYGRALRLLARADEVPMRPETVTAHVGCKLNKANVLLFRGADDPSGNIEEAIALMRDGLQYAMESPDQVARMYLNLGLAYSLRQLGGPARNEEEAMRLYEVALGTVTEGQGPAFVANIHFDVGLLYARRTLGDASDNEDAALQHLQIAVEEFARAGWDTTAAEARQARANVIGRMGRGELHNLRTAILETEQAAATMRAFGRRYEYAGAMNNLGNLYLELADLVPSSQVNSVLNQAQQALETSRTERTREALPHEWAQTTHNLGSVHMRRFAQGQTGSLQAAVGLYRDALTVRSSDDTPGAWAQSTRALALALLDTGILHDKEEADILLQTVVDAGHEAVGPDDVLESWSLLGDVASRSEDWPRAAECYREAVELAETRLSLAILPGTALREAAVRFPLFAGLANAQARSGDALATALTLERSRARLLGNAMDRDRRDLANLAEIDPALHEDYSRAAARVRALTRLQAVDLRPHSDYQPLPEPRVRYADLGQARTSLAAVEQSVEERLGITNSRAVFTADDLKQVVENGTPLLYFWVAGEALAVTVCTVVNQQLDVQTMVGSSGGAGVVLDRLVLPGLSAVAGSRRTLFLAHLKSAAWADIDIDALCLEVGQALPASLWDWLRDSPPAAVTIVPCGPLALAPLHAAIAPGTADERLIDHTTVAYAPSARILARLPSVGRPMTRIALFGDPSGNLYWARREAKELAARFPSGSLHIGAQATKASIIASLGNVEVLHFAGHGHYDPDNPLGSGLGASDGVVTLAEIADAAGSGSPSARMVVLSACDTAVSDILSVVDEAIGLPTAFLLAGVDAVVASLWPVFDESTAELMRYFYDGLLRGTQPAAALCAAQKKLRAGGVRSAAQWAPFVYLGS